MTSSLVVRGGGRGGGGGGSGRYGRSDGRVAVKILLPLLYSSFRLAPRGEKERRGLTAGGVQRHISKEAEYLCGAVQVAVLVQHLPGLSPGFEFGVECGEAP